MIPNLLKFLYKVFYPNYLLKTHLNLEILKSYIYLVGI